MESKRPIGTCLICKHAVRRSDLNIFRTRTHISKTLLSCKLSRILQTHITPVRHMSQDVCRSCCALLNQLDDCECRLLALENEVKLKYRLPFTINVQSRVPPGSLPIGALESEYCQDIAGSACPHTYRRTLGGDSADHRGVRQRSPESVCGSADEAEESDGDSELGTDSDVSEPESTYGMIPVSSELLEPDGEPEPDPTDEPEPGDELEPEIPTPNGEPELKPESGDDLEPEPVVRDSVSAAGGVATRRQQRARRAGRPRLRGPYDRPEPFTCDFCQAQFFSEASLSEHSFICSRLLVTEVTDEKNQNEAATQVLKRKRGRPRVVRDEDTTTIISGKPIKGQSSEEKTAQRDEYNRRLSAALADYQDGLSVRLAAARHGVQRSTLYDRVTGRVRVGAGYGRRCTLSADTEARLASWLIDRVRGAVGKQQLLGAVRTFLDSKNEANSFKGSTPTDTWLKGFMIRNPTVAHHITVIDGRPRRDNIDDE